MDLSIVVVSFNTKKLTLECLNSIIRHAKGIKYEIIVVENASTDGSLEAVRQLAKRYKTIKLIVNKKNVFFGPGNNQGMRRSKGRFILLLNSDTLLQSNVLGEMVNWMDQNQNVGITTCMLKNTDGSIQGTGGYFPTLPRVFSWLLIQDFPFVDIFVRPFHPMKEKSFSKADAFYKQAKELDWITGAFFMMRREVYENIGNFDEKYLMYTEETDYCYRAKQKGWTVYYNPKWSIIHHGGASGTKENTVLGEFAGVKRFYTKYFPKWQYYLLRIFLKLGSLGRIVVFYLKDGKELAGIYAKAFKMA